MFYFRIEVMVKQGSILFYASEEGKVSLEVIF